MMVAASATVGVTGGHYQNGLFRPKRILVTSALGQMETLQHAIILLSKRHLFARTVEPVPCMSAVRTKSSVAIVILLLIPTCSSGRCVRFLKLALGRNLSYGQFDKFS